MRIKQATKSELEEAVKSCQSLRQIVLRFYQGQSHEPYSRCFTTLQKRLIGLGIDFSHLSGQIPLEALNERSLKWAKSARQRREDPKYRPSIILTDSRRTDKKKNRPNDLTKEFIKRAIAEGCKYCGERSLLMTLDRIDNDKGHTKDNVVASCVRCNYMRRDMPIYAWLVIAKSVKEARERKLFGTWTGCQGNRAKAL